ncbi:hypothetical protein J2Z37_002065 [Ammoniphilus resinae]|uniref:Uncharacterized protein n=1 Tax=Ammoniphilus resinae TaxID=861532 RepID=A0ABS4GP79_9BACL|nr:hypothetical protein [Ammoniphilus resinae]
MHSAITTRAVACRLENTVIFILITVVFQAFTVDFPIDTIEMDS